MYMAGGINPGNSGDGIQAITRGSPASIKAIVTAAVVSKAGNILQEDIPAGDSSRAGSGR